MNPCPHQSATYTGIDVAAMLELRTDLDEIKIVELIFNNY